MLYLPLLLVLFAPFTLAKLEFDPDRYIILLKDKAEGMATVQSLGINPGADNNNGNSDHVDKFLNNLKAIAEDENNAVSAASAGNGANRFKSQVTGSYSRRHGHMCNMVVGRFSKKVMERTKAQLGASIQSIEPDHVAKISSGGIYRQTNPPSWGLYRTSQWYNQNRTYYYPKSSGSGVDVWVVDTGIQSSNADFYGRAQSNATFVATETTMDDTNGHGTFVAGVIGSWTYGVAKRCNLYGVKTMDKDGEGYFSWIIAGVQHASKYIRPGKTVINLSLAGPQSNALNAALKAASDLGAAVIVAAGNDATDACNTSPGGAPGIISVGATDSTDTVAPYSNYGTCVSLFAPGSNIKSLSHTATGAQPPTTLSGTSMASPHVAGTAALWMADWDYKVTQNLYNDLKIYASTGRIKGLANNSPDRLLYSWGDYQY